MEISEIQSRMRSITEFFSSGRVTNHDEAKAMLAKIRDAEGDMRTLKRDINHHMKQIRARYSAESTNVGNDMGSALIGLAVGQKREGVQIVLGGNNSKLRRLRN